MRVGCASQFTGVETEIQCMQGLRRRGGRAEFCGTRQGCCGKTFLQRPLFCPETVDFLSGRLTMLASSALTEQTDQDM